MTTITATQIQSFVGQVATVRVESFDATGQPFHATLTGRIDAMFPDEIETFGFWITTGPDEGLGLTVAEVASITAADPADAAKIEARLALAERHAAERAEMEARHEAEQNALVADEMRRLGRA